MIEPLADVKGEYLSFQVIEYRPPEAFAEPLRGFGPTILMHQIILRETMKLRAYNADTIRGGIEANGAMGRSGEPMPIGRLNQTSRN